MAGASFVFNSSYKKKWRARIQDNAFTETFWKVKKKSTLEHTSIHHLQLYFLCSRDVPIVTHNSFLQHLLLLWRTQRMCPERPAATYPETWKTTCHSSSMLSVLGWHRQCGISLSLKLLENIFHFIKYVVIHTGARARGKGEGHWWYGL